MPVSSLTSTRADRLLVIQSVELLEPRLPELSEIFYQRLFALDPAAQLAFKGSESFRQRKFINMFIVFRHIKYLENMTQMVHLLGERHSSYHRQFPLFLPAIWQALLETLQAALPDAFGPDLARAWFAVYNDVSALMAETMPTAPERRTIEPSAAWQGIERRNTWQVRTDEGLLEAIGGADKVLQVHEAFYDALFADPWLGQFFSGKNKKILTLKQTEFMVSAFGGPHEYRGSTPAVVHMHMYITAEQADIREKYLRQAILSQGLSAEIAERWLAVDRLFRPAVVKASVAECALICMGQRPIEAKKPIGYREKTYLNRQKERSGQP